MSRVALISITTNSKLETITNYNAHFLSYHFENNLHQPPECAFLPVRGRTETATETTAVTQRPQPDIQDRMLRSRLTMETNGTLDAARRSTAYQPLIKKPKIHRPPVEFSCYRSRCG